jgi:hypothetical protein
LGVLGDSGKSKGEKRKGPPLVMLRKNSHWFQLPGAEKPNLFTKPFGILKNESQQVIEPMSGSVRRSSNQSVAASFEYSLVQI